ncbi:hypothetical protein MMC06_004238 [Schaereria dolodes]|nr:hypothetical protein [Schaereria dolodes]
MEALQQEKKRRKQGKRLNLMGVKDSGPQFYSPAKVQAAQDFQAGKEEEEALRQHDISERKALAAANKEQKVREQLERRQHATKMRAAKAIERQARKEANEVAKQQNKEQLRLQRQSIMASEPSKTFKKQRKQSINTVIVVEDEPVITTNSRGRQIQRPQRFL